MDFKEILFKRHSIRKFQNKEVNQEIILEIIKLANLSPSAGNLQARNIVIVKNKDIKDKISMICFNQNFIKEAPIVLVICANIQESGKKYGEKGEKFYALQDATIFGAYLQLISTYFNLGSCWIGAFDENEISNLLNLPSFLKPIAIMPLGYSAEEPFLTNRKEVEKIVFKIFD